MLIGSTSMAQGLVQGLGLISGILVIRILPPSEYALYTLGNSMLGAMVLLANGGISKGVMAQGSKVWKNKNHLGEVMVTGLHLRKKFILASLIIGIPILFYLLLQNDASITSAILIIIALIPAFTASISNALLVIVPQLHQNIRPLQINQIGVNLGRLLLLLASILFFPIAYVALLSAGISQIFGNYRLKKIALQHVNLNQKPSPVIRKKIIKTVSRIFPESVYYAFSSQITIWLLSIFGTTKAVAEIGALNRIAVLLTLFTMVFNILIAPRFARLTESFQVLLKRYSLVVLILLIVLLVVVSMTYWFSSQILWVLGADYNNLNTEIVWLILGATLSLIAGLIYNLYSGRGWIQHPLLAISISFITLVVGITVIDVSSLMGAIKLNILVGLVQFLSHLLYGYYKIFKLKNN
ncbi:polysaccharide biosynthesis protein [Tamlana sp. 62-3]|uniref:Polysaccharide biosynthesis protein n=1 Tax=Neotamlana sargassicola TaxID=2883125 RepID=A0A9X1L8T9_9FLAO|nr:polysaccharide biosynthesis protein [Tamlana sargassicola]MCB4809208.1 polysaccharide biosynthesis protein [Tamlana sargassicola]